MPARSSSTTRRIPWEICNGASSSGNYILIQPNQIMVTNNGQQFELTAAELQKLNTLSNMEVIGITGSDTDHGVSVETVAEDSPAEKAGICEGDLILRVDDVPVKSIADINKIKNNHRSGDKIKITLYRDGEIKELEITL